jgi:phospholipid-binding lipoprotein MlaA
MYRFDRAFDRRLLRPVARGYDRFVPEVVDKKVRNVFDNLRGPVDIVNNLLQGKFVKGFSSLGRFLFNSTAGIGGLFDPATKVGLERHAEDFGQTLAVWGVPPGSYLIVPFLGPRSLRDWGGWAVDNYGDLLIRVDDQSTRNSLVLWRYISDRAVALPAEPLLEESFDEYVVVREAYWQNRLYEIRNGAIVSEDYLFLEDDE